MLSQADFSDQIADAYAHLYDLAHLRSLPLADLLVPDPSLTRGEKAWQMHHLLLNAINEIRPEPQVPVQSRQWRRYQLLVLRYLKVLDPQAVADQLMIGRRHYYREHAIALAAIATILWDRYVARPAAPEEESQPEQRQETLGRLELLRLEAARAAQADRYVHLEEVTRGVIPLLDEMQRQHQLAIRPEFCGSLPAISMDRGILRQILLGMLGYLSERACGATIRLGARLVEVDQEPAIALTVRIEPVGAILPSERAEDEERLAALNGMAALYGARVEPLRAGPGFVGFEMQLRVAERPVLVVDDNRDVLELFRRYLSPHRYRVITAQTPGEALDLACRLRPHAITLDLMMPRQDGWELLQVLLNQPETRRIPVVVCSVLRQKELALSLGAAAFLEKPVKEQALLSALEALDDA